MRLHGWHMKYQMILRIGETLNASAFATEKPAGEGRE